MYGCHMGDFFICKYLINFGYHWAFDSGFNACIAFSPPGRTSVWVFYAC